LFQYESVAADCFPRDAAAMDELHDLVGAVQDIVRQDEKMA
jgi:hypothetical protein